MSWIGYYLLMKNEDYLLRLNARSILKGTFKWTTPSIYYRLSSTIMNTIFLKVGHDIYLNPWVIISNFRAASLSTKQTYDSLMHKSSSLSWNGYASIGYSRHYSIILNNNNIWPIRVWAHSILINNNIILWPTDEVPLSTHTIYSTSS